MPLHHGRDPALCERDLARYRARHPHLFPDLEQTPDVDDLKRGEVRLAADAMLAVLEGRIIPQSILRRARETAAVMAKG